MEFKHGDRVEFDEYGKTKYGTVLYKRRISKYIIGVSSDGCKNCADLLSTNKLGHTNFRCIQASDQSQSDLSPRQQHRHGRMVIVQLVLIFDRVRR